jgi:putative membrane-bound dehydrogenase-like protein
MLLLASMGSYARQDEPPYPPERSMSTMQVENGFRLELVASEPRVQSPVAMDIDEHGRLFVVEMPGYPLDVSPTGRIKLLEDSDGDGEFERATVFADSLVLPTGVMRWKKGVLVTAAPDVLYLEDSDGDGRADVRQVVLTGFPRTNPQHTVNSPIYGLDNWVYVANQGPAGAVIYTELFGDRGALLTFPGRPGVPGVDARDSTVRFRPDAFEVEPIAGESQFGHTFDAYGRYFGNDNSHHLWHEVIAARYLRRNPHLLIGRAMQDVPDHGAAAVVFPITERPTFELLTEAGEFTSACAPTAYLGGAFPASHRSSLFVAEPVHNLVHRDVLEPSGPTFSARRAEERREFLAAGDAWFRPVNFSVGPDGALYIVDYYRGRIEHPEWTASDAQRDPAALYAGRERGRIYRVVHESMAGRPRRRPQLGTAPTASLVAALADSNVWWRRTAQRLLVDRRDPAAPPLLKAVVRARESLMARLHALWILHAMGELDAPLVFDAMRDADPGIRENAVVLAELIRADGLEAELVRLAADPDPRVRLQVLATMGGMASPAAAAVHERLLFSEIEDPWMQVAGLSAGSERAARLLARALSGPDAITSRRGEGRALFIRRAASIVGARSESAEIEALVGMAAGASESPSSALQNEAWWRAAALEGLADGAGGRKAAEASLARARRPLLHLVGGLQSELRHAGLRLLELSGGVGEDDAARAALSAAERIARGWQDDADLRADAVRLLALDAATDRARLLESLVDPKQPEAVQAAAVDALGTVRGRRVGLFLLERWEELTPEVRSRAADAMLRDADRTRLLVSALRDGSVQPWALNFSQKRVLLMHRDADVRDASRALLEADPRKRDETVRRYAAALDRRGDAERGRQVFERACAMCHRMGDAGGGDLGPDLATVRHRPPLLLLGDILLPSQAIAQKYETYVVERASGDVLTGVIAAQSPTAITLRTGPGQDTIIARRDIRKLAVLPQSSMPADLDRIVSPDEMADLLAHISRP